MNGKKLSRGKIFIFAVLIFALLLMLSETAVAIINSILADSKVGAYSITLIFLPAVSFTATLFIILSYLDVKNKSEILIKSLDRVAHGDYSAVIEVKTSGYFSAVYENFNKMTKELTSVKELRAGFVHELSHEIKTPLCSIEGFANLMLDGNLTEEERVKYLKIIASEAERIRNYAEGILTLSRLEHQEVAGERSTFRLDSRIRDCVVALQRSWESKNIEIDLDLTPVTVTTDGNMLGHVFTNLLENAIKFSNNGGQIRVTLKKYGGFVCVTVADGGAGIPEAEVDKVFDKYYRGSNVCNTDGSGIGLAVCKRLCELLNAQISCKSKVGEGSEFTVKIPV